MSNAPMSDTPEKLEQKIFNLVYQWGEVGIVADHTAPTYVAYIQELIDSAKREVLEEVKKDSIAISLHGSIGYDDVVLVEDIDNRIAQLQEQSGGEKNE